MAVVGHRRQIQILDRHQAVRLGELGCSLVPEVTPAIGRMLVVLGDLSSGLAPTRTVLLAPEQATLCDS